MNPFRHAPIFLVGFVIVIFSSNINYAKETCVDGKTKSTRGQTMKCIKKDSDIYESWFNLFDIENLEIKSIETTQLNNEQSVQIIKGKINSTYFNFHINKTPRGFGHWDETIVSKNGIIHDVKTFAKIHGYKVKIKEAEYFYHRRAVLLRYDSDSVSCVSFHRIKDEYYLIRVRLCFIGPNFSVQEAQIEAVKKYLHRDIKFATRAENQAAYGNAKKTTSASTSSSSLNTNTSVARKSETALCNLSLPAENKGVMWDTGAGYRKYVDEAKRRRYTPESCAKALGRTVTAAKATSSPSNTSDQSFKRKMCDSTKASAKVQANFMQSLSENELTRFLESGQDCSIF